MIVLITKLRVQIENGMRVFFFLLSLDFEIEMRFSQKSDICVGKPYNDVPTKTKLLSLAGRTEVFAVYP